MHKKYSKNYFQLSDLYLAYRKAKSDAFYEKLHPSALDYTKYEEKLDYHLKRLLKKLNTVDWFNDLDILGGFLYVPKSCDSSIWNNGTDSHYQALDPVENWKRLYHKNGFPINTKYRLIIDATIDFQVISALWILKVGHLYEEKIDSELSYGNRLRRHKNDFGVGSVNHDSQGLFQPYFSGYKQWRDNGLKSMRNAMHSNKEVHAITMDLSSFYHNINPGFMLEKEFLELLDLTLDKDNLLFTDELLKSINTWYMTTPDYENTPSRGIPVGLSASKIISNVLMYQFDFEITSALQPLYYGRYVDDIFLVIESPESVNDGGDILSFIEENCTSLRKGNNAELMALFSYAKDSHLVFSKEKHKVFHLKSDFGLDLVNQIYIQIKKQSSEYRLLPELPLTAQEMAACSLLNSSDASLEADALRKTDAISIKRLGFALLLSDVESYSRDLIPSKWINIREMFYEIVDRYLMSPNAIFNYTLYYSRIFSIMISCNDTKHANRFIDKLIETIGILEQTTTDGSHDNLKTKICKKYFVKLLIQSGLQASTVKGFTKWTALGRIIRKLYNLSDEYKIASRKNALMKKSRELLLSDLGKRSYKEYWYYSQNEDINIVDIPKQFSIKRILRLGIIRDFQNLALLKTPHWPALAFPTRALSIQEIAVVMPKVLEDQEVFKKIILGLRGARVKTSKPIGFDSHVFNVPSNKISSINIALTSYMTKESQWRDAIQGSPDRSPLRYLALNSLINKILKDKQSVDYITFPECSIPRRWAFSIARKLAQNNISFIAGLEYYKDAKKANQLKNDTMVSLTTNWPGYNSHIIYTQTKLKPAHEEKKILKNDYKKTLIEGSKVKDLPIYKHGDYCFGVLICSDLTDMSNRLHFQGQVDSLFVLEWNQDINTFSFLIESAAHDLHTFVIQVNNRVYGDSRIRVPYKNEYERDMIRIKGGISDFYVIGKIDYQKLRKFQRQKRPAKKQIFKPLPIGFKLASWRKK